MVLSGSRAAAQALDELQRPLLNKNQATVVADYGQFTLERGAVALGVGSYTYFEPAYKSLAPGVGFGISKRVQLTVSGAYLPPVERPYALFGDRTSTLDSRLMVRSLRAELLARPTDEVQVSVAYLGGSSRYTGNFPFGSGTSSADRQSTDMLQVRGIWLPQADAVNRPLRADLDGLTGPLLRRHRASLTWDALWRRYGRTANDHGPGSAAQVDYDSRSTDARVRAGAGFGITDRLQVATDGYWQPPFTVIDLTEVSGPDVFEHTADDSVRFSGVFGWRADARWRLAPQLELFGGPKIERQSVRDAAETARGNTFRQTGVDSGITWLARAPQSSVPWQADLSGLYRPLLDRHQLRLDAGVYVRRYDDAGWHAHSTIWRARATVGVFSTFQAGVYAGRFANGGDADERGNSLGADLRFRPTRRLEAYGTFDYYPLTSLERYPAFILNRGSFLRSFQDFTNTAYLDSASVHAGLRLVF